MRACANGWTGRSLRALSVHVVPVFALALTVSSVGWAADASSERMEQARAAYARGAASYDAGDYTTAANEFARADERVPSSTALELALKSVLRADNPVLGMELVQRSEGRDLTTPQLVQQVREKFGTRVGVAHVICPSSPCSAAIDGTAVESNAKKFLSLGDHTIEWTLDGTTQRQSVRIEPGMHVQLSPPESSDVSKINSNNRDNRDKVGGEPNASGLSPTWFWIGAGVTGVLASVAVVSALDTKSKSEAFDSNPTPDTQSAGESSQLRTNVIAGTAVAAGLTTIVLGAFFVRWKDPSPSTTTTGLSVGVGLRSIDVTARF